MRALEPTADGATSAIPVCSAGPGCEQPTAISPLVLLGAAAAGAAGC